MPSRIRKLVVAVPALYFLLFFGLSGVGLLGPDEPRYASIGREMALSGDWVTPRLWGEPWFEKPALLYWMTGLGFKAGLGDELAPRLPVALMSCAFLIFFWWRVRREFGEREAWIAAVILGTSAGWLAFSHLAVTDLPMSAAFGVVVLLALPWVHLQLGAPSNSGEAGSRWERPLAVAGIFLGVAVLAKGLVPLVLILPLLWIGRRQLPDLWRPAVLFLVVAAPWYVACTLTNGPGFLYDFFWKHHFGRFLTPGLRHVQPFWFYVPVLLAGLLPWTFALPLACRRRFLADARLRFLILVVTFGLVFFSLSTNKLPGYILPLLPPLAVLLGVALARAAKAGAALVAAALSLGVIPFAAAVLPGALMVGLSRAEWQPPAWYVVAPVILVAALVWWWERTGRREQAVTLVALACMAGIIFLEVSAFPVLDRTVSVRGLWRRISSFSSQVCVERVHRQVRYGLNYYSVVPLPGCAETEQPFHIRQQRGKPPSLEESTLNTSPSSAVSK